MGGSRRRRPYAAFLPLSLRCLLQLPPPLSSSSSSVSSFVRSKPLTLPLPPRSRVGSFVGFQKEKEKCGETLGGENLALTPSLFLVLFSFSRTHFIHFSLALSPPFLTKLQKKRSECCTTTSFKPSRLFFTKKRKRRRRFCMRGRERPFSFPIFVGRARYICHQPTRVPLLRPAFFRRGGSSRTKMRSPEERDKQRWTTPLHSPRRSITFSHCFSSPFHSWTCSQVSDAVFRMQ